MIVHFFAAAREIAQVDSWAIEFDESVTIRELRDRIGNQFPALASLLPRCAFAVNHEYADDGVVVINRDEVAVLPPVSGG